MNTLTPITASSAVPREEEEEPAGAFFSALPVILWHRRWLILVPLLVTAVAGALAAFLIHPIYQSSATLLIEAPQLSSDLLASQAPMNDMIGQRVARARERVLSRMDLIRLIRAYDLYPSEQRTMPLSKIIDKMRDDTAISAVEADLAASARRGAGNTIAITIAFKYDDPAKAQVVTQQFVNRFLEVDAGTQASQANDSVNFLTEQANSIQSRIAAIENKVTAIKAENGPILALGTSTGDPTADLARIDAQIVSLNAENTRLASTPAEIKDESGVAQAEAQLRVAEAKFSDTHPDVIAARAQLAAARQAAAAKPRGPNPIAGQIAANRTQIAALQQARSMIQSRSSNLSAAQARGPALLGQVDTMEKQADILREQARSVGMKLQSAQIQARMENEQKGERLTLADPPVVPDSPIWPNRPVLALGSIVAGLGIGVGLALLLELLLRPLRGVAGVKNALGQAPLALVPDMDEKPGRIMRMLERRARRKRARA